jgi:hypothetical protein
MRAQWRGSIQTGDQVRAATKAAIVRWARPYLSILRRELIVLIQHQHNRAPSPRFRADSTDSVLQRRAKLGHAFRERPRDVHSGLRSCCSWRCHGVARCSLGS